MQRTMTDRDIIAGIDEVGRGAFFGDACVAAAIAPLSVLETIQVPKSVRKKDGKPIGSAMVGIGDSKKRKAQISRLFAAIDNNPEIVWRVDWATVEEIEEWGIEIATHRAMGRCLRKLPVVPDRVLVDGKRFISSYPKESQEPIAGGDATNLLIGAASIIAKHHRDTSIRTVWHPKYPQYGLDSHVGYGTDSHRQALRQYGLTPHHRRSFCRKYQ